MFSKQQSAQDSRNLQGSSHPWDKGCSHNHWCSEDSSTLPYTSHILTVPLVSDTLLLHIPLACQLLVKRHTCDFLSWLNLVGGLTYNLDQDGAARIQMLLCK